MLFLNPLLGAAIGGSSGALSGRLTDIGINDKFMKDLGATFTNGTSALFVLVRKSTPDKVMEGLKPFVGKGTVLQTSLTKDKDAELRAFMRKLDVKEIHGYQAALGLELIKPDRLGGAGRKKRKK